jgi:hypothetical protein
MADYHDPTWLVQRAWSQFRLPKLQSLIELTIHDLEDGTGGHGCGEW